MSKVPSSLGLLIGIPTLGRLLPLQWALAYKSLNCPINYNANTMVLYGHPVDEARNKIAEQAIELKSKFLFFLGDDVVPPPHTLKQLIFRLEQNPEIGVVGGVYCSKSEPSAPLVFRGNGSGSYWDWKVGEFFEVTGMGMDCTLIRTNVFQKLSKPWFKTIENDGFLDGINHSDSWTEDIYFLKRVVEETEYKVYCDGGIICDHYDGNRAFNLPPTSLPMRRLKVDKLKRAIDIGSGPINRAEQFPEYELVRVDIREECNPDYRCDVRILPFANEEFDLVFSSHVLEHFSREETKSILTEWLRILKSGGEFIITVPNLLWAYENQAHKQSLDVIYGAQTNDYDFHKTGFTQESLKLLLEEHSLTDIKFDFTGFNMIVKAKKL